MGSFNISGFLLLSNFNGFFSFSFFNNFINVSSTIQIVRPEVGSTLEEVLSLMGVPVSLVVIHGESSLSSQAGNIPETIIILGRKMSGTNLDTGGKDFKMLGFEAFFIKSTVMVDSGHKDEVFIFIVLNFDNVISEEFVSKGQSSISTIGDNTNTDGDVELKVIPVEG